ncbi:MAG: glycosyltransferase [Paraclostridium sp.]
MVKNKNTISLCMIVKDEEDVIGRCLDCLKDLVDEIIIIDTGSTDKTKEIVSKYTDEIYDFEWIDDFGAARNYAFSKATKEYIFWIDADEVVFEKDQKEFLKLKESLTPDIDIVMMNDHRGLNEKGEPLLVYKRTRMVKRSKNFKWVGFIHEYLEVHGNSINANIALTHQKLKGVGDRNLRIYRNKLSEGHELSLRDVYYYGKELYYNGIYDDAIEILEEFLEKEAWIEEKIDAACKLSDCYFYKRKHEKAREMLYKTFEYTTPRAEAVYRIGLTFEMQGRYKEAINWYESILNLEMPKGCSGFITPSYWTWKPHLQLTVCNYKIGNIEKSKYHHRKSYEINPLNKAISTNEKFFNNLEK